MYKKSAEGSRAVAEKWMPVHARRVAAIFFLTSYGGVPIISHTRNRVSQ